MADESLQDLYDPRALAGDDGKTEMVIFAHHQKIIQRFARPMLFVAYDPQNMGEIVNRILAAVKETGHTTVINMPKRKITKAQRDALITRALHVYRSMAEKHRPRPPEEPAGCCLEWTPQNLLDPQWIRRRTCGGHEGGCDHAHHDTDGPPMAAVPSRHGTHQGHRAR